MDVDDRALGTDVGSQAMRKGAVGGADSEIDCGGIVVDFGIELIRIVVVDADFPDQLALIAGGDAGADE